MLVHVKYFLLENTTAIILRYAQFVQFPLFLQYNLLQFYSRILASIAFYFEDQLRRNSPAQTLQEDSKNRREEGGGRKK